MYILPLQKFYVKKKYPRHSIGDIYVSFSQLCLVCTAENCFDLV